MNSAAENAGGTVAPSAKDTVAETVADTTTDTPATRLADQTAAIAVVYGIDTTLGPWLAALRREVAQVVLVDNTEQGHPALRAWPDTPGLALLHRRNQGALAGAYNGALQWLAQHRPELQQVVLVDDDSDPRVLKALLLDPAVRRVLALPDTAAVAPAYVDRATGLRGRHIELQRWHLHHLPREIHGLRGVAFVINSMSVWKRAALARIGPFNEGLAIDHVDTEYCLRARQLGLRVYVAGDHEFAHSIGQRRRYTLFGRSLQAGGHAPSRRYLIGRNTAWLGRRYVWREPAFAWLCASRLAYEAVGIVMAEPQKLPKLMALLRGAVVGLFTWRLRW